MGTTKQMTRSYSGSVAYGSGVVDTLTLYTSTVDDRHMGTGKSDLLQGTLDLLILKVVALGPIHGYAIAQRIRQISKDVLQVQQGSLYPALHRLENRKWLKADWREAESGREAKFYSLTDVGRKQLKIEEDDWEQISTAIRLVLRTVE